MIDWTAIKAVGRIEGVCVLRLEQIEAMQREFEDMREAYQRAIETLDDLVAENRAAVRCLHTKVEP